MITEEEYRRLKEEAEETNEKAQRARGALEQIMAQLKTQFGCKSIEQARKMLKELQSQRDAAGRRLDKAVRAYKEKWSESDDEHD